MSCARGSRTPAGPWSTTASTSTCARSGHRTSWRRGSSDTARAPRSRRDSRRRHGAGHRDRSSPPIGPMTSSGPSAPSGPRSPPTPDRHRRRRGDRRRSEPPASRRSPRGVEVVRTSAAARSRGGDERRDPARGRGDRGPARHERRGDRRHRDAARRRARRPGVAVAGPLGLVTDDLRHFEEPPSGRRRRDRGLRAGVPARRTTSRGPAGRAIRSSTATSTSGGASSCAMRARRLAPRRAVAARPPGDPARASRLDAPARGRARPAVEAQLLPRPQAVRSATRPARSASVASGSSPSGRRSTSTAEAAELQPGWRRPGRNRAAARPSARARARASIRASARARVVSAPAGPEDRSSSPGDRGPGPSTRSASRTSQRRSSAGRSARSVSRTTASAVGRSRSSSIAATNRAWSRAPGR